MKETVINLEPSTAEEKVKEVIAESVAREMTAEGTKEVIIRKGNALELKEPEKVRIYGTIDAPARWLEKRASELNQKKCHITVNREEMSIFLCVDENNHYGTWIKGCLHPSPEFKRFAINGGKYITHFEMAELFKMNRSLFQNRTEAMKLVSELQNFKAKVDKEVEESDNKRGDRRLLVSQAVQHNLPASFRLMLPLFRGMPPIAFEAEVYVNPSDFTCTLVSPEANDIVQESRDTIMGEVLERIESVCPDIVIIEQ